MKTTKFFWLTLILTITVWGVVGIYYSLSTKKTQTQGPALSPAKEETTSIFKKAEAAGYKIIRSEVNDQIGRTAFYDWRGRESLGRIGESKALNEDKSVFTRYITGTFSGWEEIPDSSDKYLLLVNLLTNSPLPKIRILFEPNKNLPVWADVTRFGIEVLDYGPANSSEKKDLFYNFGDIAKWKMVDLEKLIKKGDAIGCFIYLAADSSGVYTNFLDENGQLVAMDLLIRRFGGKSQVDKELE